MSQENVEIVRRAFAASLSVPPDADALAALMHSDHVLTTDWGVEVKTYYGVGLPSTFRGQWPSRCATARSPPPRCSSTATKPSKRWGWRTDESQGPAE